MSEQVVKIMDLRDGAIDLYYDVTFSTARGFFCWMEATNAVAIVVYDSELPFVVLKDKDRRRVR